MPVDGHTTGYLTHLVTPTGPMLPQLPTRVSTWIKQKEMGKRKGKVAVSASGSSMLPPEKAVAARDKKCKQIDDNEPYKGPYELTAEKLVQQVMFLYAY